MIWRPAIDAGFSKALTRARVLVAVARPPVMILLAMYAATGVAAVGGDPRNPLEVLPSVAVVAGFLVFSVSVNDLADVAVDRVNLIGRKNRPLVVGTARRGELVVTAVVGAVVALLAAAWLGVWPLVTCTAGLVVSAAYSLPPIRLAARGAIASLVLPACYVAVPFLVGALGALSRIDSAEVVLLIALYVGFIGRILLKDFRDVRGDALFGKRTFLVRHGRRPTCTFAAVCWSVGTALTLYAVSMRHRPADAFDVTYLAALAGVLVIMRALSFERGVRRDELLISAVAIIGRGQLLVLLLTLSMASRSAVLLTGVTATLAVVIGGQALTMLRHGPVTRHTVPPEWIESTSTDTVLRAHR
jgi:4-hydroxybenzoate polyprenyltransferase